MLLGDNASFYYLKDVMVLPAWQEKRVGSAMMQAITYWLDIHSAADSQAGLYTGQQLASFYSSYGFKPMFGMSRKIQRKKNNCVSEGTGVKPIKPAYCIVLNAWSFQK